MFDLLAHNLYESRRTVIGAIISLLIFGAISMPALAGNLWQAQPDTAEALGSISGTVTNEAGEPLAGIKVVIGPGSRNIYGSGGSATTDTQGKYRIQGVLTGIYTLYFTDPAGQWSDIYWGNERTPEKAAKFPVAGNEVSLDMVMPAATGISGTLSSSVDFRYPSYTVTAYTQSTDPNLEEPYWEPVLPRYIMTSEAAFHFTSLEPGIYRICATVSGEVLVEDVVEDEEPLPNNYRSFTECYNDIVSSVDDAEDIIVTEATVVSGIDIELGASSQYSIISGSVSTEDNEPLAGIRVTAVGTQPTAYPYPYPYPYPSLIRHSVETTTDDNGIYQFDKLLPITTTLYFDASNTPYASEYYDDAQREDDAKNLLPNPGEVLENIDAELAIGGRLTGKILIDGKKVDQNVQMYLMRDEGDNFYYAYRYYGVYPDAYDPTTGTYLIDGLPAGIYRLEASMNYGLRSYYGGTFPSDATPITVTLGNTISDLDISIGEGQYDGAIEGNVTSAGEPLSGIHVQLLDAFVLFEPNYVLYDYSPMITYAVTDAAGKYNIGGLTTNSMYAIRFVSPNGEFAAEYFTDESGANAPVRVIDGTTVVQINGELEKGASVSGTIRRIDGSYASNYSIVVERITANGMQIERADLTTDENGYYSVAELPSGEYTLRFLPQYSPQTHLRLNIAVEPGESIVEQNGVAGPGVPTNLPTIQEPTDKAASLTESLFVPFFMR